MMLEAIINLALWAAVISTGLMAGIYFTFSVFVMDSLKALPDSVGIASMNSINKVILTSAFIPLFFGSSILAILLMYFHNDYFTSKWVISAGVIYLLGMVACTVIFSVPLNNRLQAVTLANQSQVWHYYLSHWTHWNHVRAVSSLIACVFYINALK